MPGPTWAPMTAPTWLTTRSRQVRDPLSQPRGEVVCLLGVDQVRHGDVDVLVPRRLDRELFEPAQCLGGSADLLERDDRAVLDLEQRLDRQRRTDQRGGRADATSSTEVLQGVDVEQRLRRRCPLPCCLGRLLGRGSLVERRGGRLDGEAGAHPEVPTVDAVHRDRAVPSGQLGGLEGARHLAGQVHRHDRLGARLGQRLVGAEEHLRCRTTRRDRLPALQSRGDVVRAGTDPLVVRRGADDDLERDDGHLEPLRHRGVDRRGVGDECDGSGHVW